MFGKKIIQREDGKPYLIRYYLLRTKLFQIVLHKILLSDDDCLHDHPWNFISFILKGGYWEKSEKDYKWYGRFSLLYRKAEYKHSLHLPYHWQYSAQKRSTITLVLMFKKRREWGFWTPKGFVHWTKYKSTQHCE